MRTLTIVLEEVVDSDGFIDFGQYFTDDETITPEYWYNSKCLVIRPGNNPYKITIWKVRGEGNENQDNEEW